MHRFFVPRELLTNLAPLTEARYEFPQVFPLPKELAHQVRDVIRLNIGEHLLLLDNSGDEILATVAKINKASVEVHLLERRTGRSEPAARIILCQGLLKSARFEWILEKGTELGVSVFSPIICRRSMAGLEDTGSSKIQRWQRIIQESAEQSGRSRLPELLAVRPLEHALNSIPSNALAIMPWEEEHALTLHDVLSTSIRPGRDVGATLAFALPPHDALNTPGGDVGATLAVAPSVAQTLEPRTLQTPFTIVLFIGPEGGLVAEEVALAQRHGVQVVTLGARILRAETAAIATVANIMYECEQ
jgi:16S rRNA (uracil1498-N3)-methyltransferase